MELLSSTRADVLKTVRELARYAFFAHLASDSVRFRMSAPGLGLGESVELSKFGEGHPLASLQHAWVHLGIRDKQTLVVAIGSSNNFLLTTLLKPSLSTVGALSPKEIDWGHWVYLPERPRVDGQYLLIFEELRQHLHHRLCQRLETVPGGTTVTNIEICGYGVAGALATLCALWCSTQWKHPVTCVTLGSPMVGDSNFARAFRSRNIRCYRLVLRSDASTPQFNAPIWEHVGEKILLPRFYEDFWSRLADLVIESFAVLQRLTLWWTHTRIFLGKWAIFPMFWLFKVLQLEFMALDNMLRDPSLYLTGAQRVMEYAWANKTEAEERRKRVE